MNSNQMNQTMINVIFIILSLACLLPFVLLLVVSVSDEHSIIQKGYTFFPNKLSMDAYVYLWDHAATMIRSYGITIFVTVIGTVFGLLLSCFTAYPLSRRDLPFRNILSFIVFFYTFV